MINNAIQEMTLPGFEPGMTGVRQPTDARARKAWAAASLRSDQRLVH